MSHGWAVAAAALLAALSALPAARWVGAGSWRRGDEPTNLRGRPVPALLGAFLGLAGAAVGWGLLRPGWWPAGVAMLIFLMMATPGAVIDLAVQRVPEPLVLSMQAAILAALLIGTAVTGEWGSGSRAVAAGAGAWTVVFAYRLVSDFGFADVQLVATAALCMGWVGWRPAIWAVAATFVVGGVWAIALHASGRRGSFAMAPAIVIGAVCVAAAGPLLAVP